MRKKTKIEIMKDILVLSLLVHEANSGTLNPKEFITLIKLLCVFLFEFYPKQRCVEYGVGVIKGKIEIF